MFANHSIYRNINTIKKTTTDELKSTHNTYIKQVNCVQTGKGAVR